MLYNVEIRQSLSEVESIGRTLALLRADERAWLTVVRAHVPLVAARLLEVETREHDAYAFDGAALVRRYRFDVEQ